MKEIFLKTIIDWWFIIVPRGYFMKAIQIAIDGPAGAGKSTIAKRIAKTLNYTYIDTGAMYRALTLETLRRGISLEDTEAIIALAKEVQIQFINGNIILNGENVTEAVRESQVSQAVSFVAQIPEVRKIMVEMQQKIAANDNVVMDGRDIGTYVLPKADLKIFLTASIEERAKRRYKEHLLNPDVSLEDVKQQILLRDQMDSQRSTAPLAQAPDAFRVDTTGRTIDEVVQEIISLLNQVLKK